MMTHARIADPQEAAHAHSCAQRARRALVAVPLLLPWLAGDRAIAGPEAVADNGAAVEAAAAAGAQLSDTPRTEGVDQIIAGLFVVAAGTPGVGWAGRHLCVARLASAGHHIGSPTRALRTAVGCLSLEKGIMQWLLSS